MSNKNQNLVNKVKTDLWNFYAGITGSGIFFSILIVLITALAVYNSTNPEVSITFSFKNFKLVLPGDYFYQIIFNPLWVVAAFLYERHVHSRLEANNIKIGKISALTLDAAIRKEENISIKTVNKILSDTDQGPMDVANIISDNELEIDINEFDSIDTAKEVNLKI
jgi:hypothetical protein